MSFKRHLSQALVVLLMTTSMIQSAPIESPLRVRLNSKLIKRIFHKNDEHFFDVLRDIPVDDFKLDEGLSISGIRASINHQKQEGEEFDYNVSFNPEDFLGLEAKDLVLKGNGSYSKGDDQNTNFEFEGPINKFKLSFDIVDAPENKLKTKGKKIELQSFDFEVDSEKLRLTPEDSAQSSQIRKQITEGLNKSLKQLQEKIFEGDVKYMVNVPVSSLLPAAGLYYAALASEKAKFSDDFIEFGLSPASLNLVDKKAFDQLKSIETTFEASTGDEQALSVVIDENFVNSIFASFATIDKMYSLREFMHSDPRFKMFAQLLTTSSIAMALPAFKEDYGDGKPLDVVGTLSHSYISDQIENIQMSGISLDKNGNLKLNINTGAQIIVETTPGKWEEARKFFITVAVKAKFQIDSSDPQNKTLVISPKGLELSMFKVFKGEEEMFLEQMLAQSLINVQIDQIRKQLKPFPVPLRKFENPKEFQCIGFNLTDLDLKLKKGYVQIDAGYQQIDNPNQEFCDEFEKALREGPMKAIKSMSKDFPALQKFADQLGMGLDPEGHADELEELKQTIQSDKEEADKEKAKKQEEHQHIDL